MRINWKICLISVLYLILFIACDKSYNGAQKPRESIRHDNNTAQKPLESPAASNLLGQEIVKIAKNSITQTELLGHLEFLTSERLSGRPTENNGAGITLETLITTDYLKDKCSNWSLEPAGEKQSPNQYIAGGWRTSSDSINIAFYVQGIELSKEFVVLAAHYDHLGRSIEGIYYGANDNASGVSALLELAQVFSDLYKKDIKSKRSIIFLFAGAEELGLRGSKQYAANIPFEGRVVTTISLDMVGMPDASESFDLYVCPYAKETPKRIPEIFAYAEKWKDFFGFHKINLPQRDYFGRSDHYSFWKNSPTDNRIPSFLIMAGEDKKCYHTTRDTLKDKQGNLRIDLDYLERLTEFAAILVWEIANGPRPNYIEELN